MSIAQTILNQIGGNKMIAMTGAYNLIDHGNGLSLRIKGSKVINYIKITLNSLDLYDVEMGKIHGMNYKVKHTTNGAYFDMLTDLIESETGLYLSL